MRFRMPINEAEEIGFILLIAAVSLAWATLNVHLLLILLGVVLIGLLLVAAWIRRRGGSENGMIVITFPSADYAGKSEQMLDFLQSNLRKGRIDSITENEDRSVISYSLGSLNKDRFGDLRQDVAKIEESAAVNVFFHQSGWA